MQASSGAGSREEGKLQRTASCTAEAENVLDGASLGQQEGQPDLTGAYMQSQQHRAAAAAGASADDQALQLAQLLSTEGYHQYWMNNKSQYPWLPQPTSLGNNWGQEAQGSPEAQAMLSQMMSSLGVKDGSAAPIANDNGVAPPLLRTSSTFSACPPWAGPGRDTYMNTRSYTGGIPPGLGALLGNPDLASAAAAALAAGHRSNSPAVYGGRPGGDYSDGSTAAGLFSNVLANSGPNTPRTAAGVYDALSSIARGANSNGVPSPVNKEAKLGNSYSPVRLPTERQGHTNTASKLRTGSTAMEAPDLAPSTPTASQGSFSVQAGQAHPYADMFSQLAPGLATPVPPGNSFMELAAAAAAASGGSSMDALQGLLANQSANSQMFAALSAMQQQWQPSTYGFGSSASFSSGFPAAMNAWPMMGFPGFMMGSGAAGGSMPPSMAEFVAAAAAAGMRSPPGFPMMNPGVSAPQSPMMPSAGASAAEQAQWFKAMYEMCMANANANGASGAQDQSPTRKQPPSEGNQGLGLRCNSIDGPPDVVASDMSQSPQHASHQQQRQQQQDHQQGRNVRTPSKGNNHDRNGRDGGGFMDGPPSRSSQSCMGPRPPRHLLMGGGDPRSPARGHGGPAARRASSGLDGLSAAQLYAMDSGHAHDNCGSAGRNRAGSRIHDALLEEFKSNKTGKFEFKDIFGHIYEFSLDQHGSRFIQQKLESCPASELTTSFDEVLPRCLTLMNDVFGNYVVQKFFEHGSPEQRLRLAEKLKGNVLALTQQMYGCRVIQKALEVLPVEEQCSLITELDQHIIRCVRDQNGNHVIQKVIECVKTDRITHILDSFLACITPLSTHPFGCRVVQRILEHCHDEKRRAIVMEEILKATVQLAQDQYGNYVVQHVLEHGTDAERSEIVRHLSPLVLTLSQHKFASNVVEKCLTHGRPSDRDKLIKSMLGSGEPEEGVEDPLQLMMRDQFGNYVVQKVLEVCDDVQREVLLNRVRAQLHTVKKFTYGKHVVARVEKLLSAGTKMQTQLKNRALPDDADLRAMVQEKLLAHGVGVTALSEPPTPPHKSAPSTTEAPAAPASPAEECAMEASPPCSPAREVVASCEEALCVGVVTASKACQEAATPMEAAPAAVASS